VAKHRAFELTQRAARLEAELLRKQLSGVPVHGKRLRLPPGPVQREHELAAQPLLHRIRRHQRLQLGHELARATKGKIGLDSFLQGSQAEPLEPSNLRLRVLLEPEVGERGTAPQSERLAQRRGGAECIT
jgi:hypothetical protein